MHTRNIAIGKGIQCHIVNQALVRISLMALLGISSMVTIISDGFIPHKNEYTERLSTQIGPHEPDTLKLTVQAGNTHSPTI